MTTIEAPPTMIIRHFCIRVRVRSYSRTRNLVVRVLSYSRTLNLCVRVLFLVFQNTDEVVLNEDLIEYRMVRSHTYVP
jgi:hypothetical protein